MADLGTQILATLSKNPAHTLYVKTWLTKYAGVTSTQANDVFTELYNWYYYFISEKGYGFPVIRNELAGATGLSGAVVNQFLYAIYTGYNQSKLSKEFAFPRPANMVSTTTNNAANGVNASQTSNSGKSNVTPSIKWIPDNWTSPAVKVATNSTYLTYGLIAAGAAAIWYAATHSKGK